MSDSPAWKRPLITALTGGDPDRAIEWNRQALATYDASYTGRWFDVLADRANPNEITEKDLVAVTMLSVQVAPGAAAWILGRGRREISELLEQVPIDLPIWRADEADLRDGSPADQLWHRLQSGCWPEDDDANRIGGVIAGKLLAAKRPHLIPVYDRKVREYLGVPDTHFWLPLRGQLLTPEDRLAVSVAVRGAEWTEPDRSELTLLRSIDIVLWMRGGGFRPPLEPPPD